MPDDIATPFEFHVGVTQLRESLSAAHRIATASGFQAVDIGVVYELTR
jgi:hypothetical protein